MIRTSTRRPPVLREIKRAPEEWLRPHQVMDRYGIGRTRLYGWLSSGEIPAVKLGRTWHIRVSDVEAFLQARVRLN